MAFHGHGGSNLQIAQGLSWAGHPEYWADRGYLVACVTVGDIWDSPTAMSLATSLHDWAVGLGCDPLVDVAGWSMGGGHAARWMLENPTLVGAAVLFSPVLDLDWAYTQPAWTAEIDAAYAGSYSANGSTRGPAENPSAYRGVGQVLIIHPTDDATVPYSQSTAFVAAVNDPDVTVRVPDITGGHQGGLLNVTARETWEFLRTRHAA